MSKGTNEDTLSLFKDLNATLNDDDNDDNDDDEDGDDDDDDDDDYGTCLSNLSTCLTKGALKVVDQSMILGSSVLVLVSLPLLLTVSSSALALIQSFCV